MSDELYTASRLRVFRECPRKHDFRYRQGFATPSTPPMVFGTSAHAALEQWYLAWKCGEDRLSAAIAAIESSELGEIDRIRLRTIITAYDLRWGAEDWEIVAVEVEFGYSLGDINIGGKIDAIIRERATGKIFVVEHKTSTADTSPGAPYWQKLTLDSQISIYTDGARHGLELDITGCIYDVLKRPLHEPLMATPVESRKYTQGKGCKLCGGKLTGGVQGSGKSSATRDGNCAACKGSGWRLDERGAPEAPRLHANQRDRDETLEEFEERLTVEVAERVDEFLSRGVIVRLDAEMPRVRQELLDTIALMRAADAAGIAPPNHDACAKGRDMCGFFSVCAGMADINDFPRGAVHSELTQAA